jgi:hypothetical protein
MIMPRSSMPIVRSRIAGAFAAAIREVRSTRSTTATTIVSLGLTFACGAFAQSDAELFAEGRLAFDKYKDCAAAEKALTAVSADGQNSPLWLSYMARTEECLGKLSNAINYFQHYNEAVPGQVEIINKLADLRYQLSKQQEQLAQHEALVQEAIRKQEEWSSTARMAAQRREHAKQRLAQTVSALNSLFSQKASYASGLSVVVDESCNLTIKWGYKDGKTTATESASLTEMAPHRVRFNGTEFFLGYECAAGSKCVHHVNYLKKKELSSFDGSITLAFTVPTEADQREADSLYDDAILACGGHEPN